MLGGRVKLDKFDADEEALESSEAQDELNASRVHAELKSEEASTAGEQADGSWGWQPVTRYSAMPGLKVSIYNRQTGQWCDGMVSTVEPTGIQVQSTCDGSASADFVDWKDVPQNVRTIGDVSSLLESNKTEKREANTEEIEQVSHDANDVHRADVHSTKQHVQKEELHAAQNESSADGLEHSALQAHHQEDAHKAKEHSAAADEAQQSGRADAKAAAKEGGNASAMPWVLGLGLASLAIFFVRSSRCCAGPSQ